MVETYGNYEVDYEEGTVRLKLSDGEYEYIVSEELFQSLKLAKRACTVFQYGYESSRSKTRELLRGLME